MQDMSKFMRDQTSERLRVTPAAVRNVLQSKKDGVSIAKGRDPSGAATNPDIDHQVWVCVGTQNLLAFRTNHRAEFQQVFPCLAHDRQTILQIRKYPLTRNLSPVEILLGVILYLLF